MYQTESILFVHQSLKGAHADIPGKFGVVPAISQQPLLIVYTNHLYGWQLIPQYDKYRFYSTHNIGTNLKTLD